MLKLLKPKVCNFKPSISRKELVSTAACSAASAFAGFTLRFSHRTVGLDKPAKEVVKRILLRTASTRYTLRAKPSQLSKEKRG